MLQNTLTRYRARFLRRLARRNYQRKNYHPTCGGDCSCETEICDGKKGLVLGAYDTCNKGEYQLTPEGIKFDEKVKGRLTELLKNSNLKLGSARVFNGLGEFYGVAVTGVGPNDATMNSKETLNECKENIRIAAAVGAKALQDQTVENILVEEFTNGEAAAEGAILGLWRFEEFRNEEERETRPKVALYGDNANKDLWIQGVIKARAQNLARRLEDLPANILTPREFVKAALYYLCPCGVNVQVRDYKWIQKQGMNALFNMAKGSCAVPYFLELTYCGGSDTEKPVVMVGKGVTFDSGGVCLKKCKGMDEYRADMGGAAVVVGALKAIAQLKVPLNIVGLIPLFENMISGSAIHPGDVVLSMDDRTILVEDTDNEGRVAMADALVYSNRFNPSLVVSVATLTPGIRKALGSGGAGAYTTDDAIWDELKIAGADTGDRTIRLPIWNYYRQRNKMSVTADMHNVGQDGSWDGDTALGASFLYEFAPSCADFLHLDITGVGMLTTGLIPYYRKGYMTGRPTRTVIQFIKQMATPGQDNQSPCTPPA
ncbi:manganese ion Hypothetical protein [Nesidiocoris tenuis]|uniref:Cytosol aminopeptidase n=1 Tax=Nesidiocoris tenuis TaxID=355587 RepID=A0ABN7BFN6_9HEMI|nr:manganese ion Hypothetical protein [Nesidiocoris tenuis]